MRWTGGRRGEEAGSWGSWPPPPPPRCVAKSSVLPLPQCLGQASEHSFQARNEVLALTPQSTRAPTSSFSMAGGGNVKASVCLGEGDRWGCWNSGRKWNRHCRSNKALPCPAYRNAERACGWATPQPHLIWYSKQAYNSGNIIFLSLYLRKLRERKFLTQSRPHC